MAGLERGVRPMGLWSTLMTLSKCSSPCNSSWGGRLGVAAVERTGDGGVHGVVHQGALA